MKKSGSALPDQSDLRDWESVFPTKGRMGTLEDTSGTPMERGDEGRILSLFSWVLWEMIQLLRFCPLHKNFP